MIEHMKTLIDFKEYLNDFYGCVPDALYPSGREITYTETINAVCHIFETHGEFVGDSLDCERARDFIFTKEEIDTIYSNADK